jgi:hypothetical protein
MHFLRRLDPQSQLIFAFQWKSANAGEKEQLAELCCHKVSKPPPRSSELTSKLS